MTEQINFYTRLLRMKDPATNEPMFTSFSVELACEACKEAGKSADCKHMLHLVPTWCAPPPPCPPRVARSIAAR